MKKRVLHTISRLFLLIMALQIMNVSIDAIDFKPFESNLVLTEFNDQNTITEYVAEILLGYKNLFPESKTKVQKQTQQQKHICIKLINCSPYTFNNQAIKANPSQGYPYTENYAYLFLNEINPPPPKA
jgi:hypothetical protein